MSNDEFLNAMRADAIPKGESGLWKITKYGLSKEIDVPDSRGKRWTIPAGFYTCLTCFTEATLHLGTGELVMHDVPYELKKHLIFARRAYGHVLITGLGLGCIARACLANPNVQRVTVIEKSSDVLKLVAQYMPTARLHIVQADATEWVKENGAGFDCAWHDLWVADDNEAEHLQVLHAKMIIDLADKVPVQGAWELPRMYRRLMKPQGVL
jgi:hypothetical protein